jgi:hypothetical protein
MEKGVSKARPVYGGCLRLRSEARSAGDPG